MFVYLLLWLPPVQEKIKEIALSYVTSKTKSKIEIEKFSFRPFNKVELQGIYVEDLNKDTLVYMKNLSVRFNLLPLLRNRLELSSINAGNFTLKINKKDLGSNYNFQFLIDAFASKNTNKNNQALKIIIGRLKISGGNIAYDLYSVKKQPPGVFDANHIRLSGMNAELNLNSIDVEKLDIIIKKLSFFERGGLAVKNMAARLRSDHNLYSLNDFVLQTPHSDIRIEKIGLNARGIKSSEIVEKSQYSVRVDRSKIYLGDFSSFYPSLKYVKDTLSFSAFLSGKLPAVSIRSLKLDLGKSARMELEGNLHDYARLPDSPFYLNVKGFALDRKSNALIHRFSPAYDPSAFSYLFRSKPLQLTGSVSGKLSGMKLVLYASSGIGSLAANGFFGYDMKKKKGRFDLSLKSSGINIRPLHPSLSDFGSLAGGIKAKGRFDAKAQMSIYVSTGLSELEYKNYFYRHLNLEASYDGRKAYLKGFIKDPNADLSLNVNMNFRSKTSPVLDLKTDINNLDIGALNLFPLKNRMRIRTKLTAGIVGFNPDRMKAKLNLENLNFRSDKGSLDEGPVSLDYEAAGNMHKILKFNSDPVEAGMEGVFSLKSIYPSLMNTIGTYIPGFFPSVGKRKYDKDWISLKVSTKNSQKLCDILGLPFSFADQTNLSGKYSGKNHYMNFVFYSPAIDIAKNSLYKDSLILESDTLSKRIDIRGSSLYVSEKKDTASLNMAFHSIQSGLTGNLSFKSRLSNLVMNGEINPELTFNMVRNKLGLIDIKLDKTYVTVNDERFDIDRSDLKLIGDRYVADSLSIYHKGQDYLKLFGAVSKNPSDTLNVLVTHANIKSLADIFSPGSNIDGIADGEIIASNLFSSRPLFMTKDYFKIDSISMADNKLGNLKIYSGWDNNLNGIFFKAGLKGEKIDSCSLAGYYQLSDSMLVDAKIPSFPLDYLSPYTQGMLYGLSGSVGLNLRAQGSLKMPRLNGTFYFRDAGVGISMLGVKYNFSDSMKIDSDRIDIKDFRINDENKHFALLNGKINYKGLTGIEPDINLKFSNFLVVNNTRSADSLFYGSLKVSGSAEAFMSNKSFFINASVSNGNNSVLNVNVPMKATEAVRYENVTFINNKKDTLAASNAKANESATAPKNYTLPLIISASISVNPNFKIGVSVNSATNIKASATGSGNVDFSYDMNNNKMSIYGGYTVNSGEANISFKGLASKKFSIQDGGTLSFNGDPMKAAFDLTALYSLKADLTTLDDNAFKDFTTSSRVPVNCLLSATGSMDNIKLNYDIVFPGGNDELKKKADGLMSTEEEKIMQIAYLLAFGSFYSSNALAAGPNLSTQWTSLATSSLNSAFANLLNDNWSIGTELHSSDNNFNQMEMGLNVSTQLFNKRMTINTNLGYSNYSNNDNFTGDFELRYKLDRSGNLVLRAYNVTNNQYYERATAKMTQGVGLEYKKESRTFKGLFHKIFSIFR